MLRTLRIRNLAVLQDVAIEFGPGLNVLTGETGAGKSILVDALSLATGARADTSRVRAGADRARIEADFALPGDSEVPDLLAARGIEFEDATLVVRREIAAVSGGRVFLNDSPCTLTSLREVGARLIDLLGQHAHQELLSRNLHQDLLDVHGGHGTVLGRVRDAYDAVRDLEAQIADWEGRRAHARERADLLRAQLEDIDAVAPRDGEREELERERRLLRNAERIAERVEGAIDALQSDDGAATVVARASRALEELGDVDEQFGARAAQLDAARLEIEDVAEFLRDAADGTRYDPSRLEDLESRLADLERLFLRYGADAAAVQAHRDEIVAELAGLDDVGGTLDRLRAHRDEAAAAWSETAASLSEARRAAAVRLGPAVEKALASLEMKRARFAVGLEPNPGGGMRRDGAERVEFRLAANPGDVPRPLARAASGGELSRVMLALHGVLGEGYDGQVLVFDEVDAGIGGAVADAVGSRLAALARTHQVLCVTHLPQVAAHANRHLVVSKRVRGGATHTDVREVVEAERIDEVARMLGGRKVSTASRRNAEDLIRAAGRMS